MTLFRLHMVKQILPSGRIVSWSPWSSWNFCPRCARAKICQDDLGLHETIYRPREELYNTKLTAILLFFGSCDISTMKSNFSLQVYFAVVEGSDKMGNFEVRKSDLSKRLDGRIKLNFSMLRRDITGTSFLYESPRSIQWVTGSSPRRLVERGASYRRLCRLSPVDVSGIRFSYYYFRQRVLECSEPYAQAALLDTSCTCKIRVQPEDFFDLVDLLLRHWAESSYH